ncbi:hypothetical protein [Flaviaesturariibacter aridisoli]|uniref:Tetratricopeptide repeat protein n=1 Tax=Flaviaesturariibacter aridisoli TaxID=2545761 RepID=A0A4R4E7W5_9BACT|nr:hypothetical protein [Flaviaesturariibacter aridisoli]TCZ73838.1 hypothetical protein E0486_03925 [Flaviaesturariibacter aridisoli]
MAAPMNRLSESLFQKSFADCSVEELRQLTAQYPYFAPAHFLLLKKFDPASEEYRRQYQKAQLYFHDPVSFEFFLHRPEHGIGALENEVSLAHSVAGPEVSGLTTEVPAEPEPETALIVKPVAPEAEVSDVYETPTSIEEHEVDVEEEDEAPLPGLAGINLNAAPVGELSFGPFHAVDYFASQGIRLSREEVGTDKFGKQLKSFTDWLKTMKRITPEAAAPADARAEAGVEHMASHSVKESEIVTESMAEVWLKQGNRKKAAEIYRKLSLLHPAKSAYFADKINSLNA